MLRLTSITITKNEATQIGDCLDSLAFCNERVVVDSGSSDDTVRICRQKGARVIVHEWCGFGPQRNFALTVIDAEWVLWVDADEVVSPELATSIVRAIDNRMADGYRVARRSRFCGRTMMHSGWNPDYVIRLFRRGKGRWTDAPVHEHAVVEGRVETLPGFLLHHPVERLEEALQKMDLYSTLGAEGLVASGRKVWFVTGIFRGLFAFLRSYILRAGFLDGREGFLLAVANAEGTYYRFMKAWLATRRRG
jgi:glycosyltransferase involved in cell wall biosynthesis